MRSHKRFEFDPKRLELVCSRYPLDRQYFTDITEILRREKEALPYSTIESSESSLVIPGILEKIPVEHGLNSRRVWYVLRTLRRERLIGSMNRYEIYYDFLKQFSFVDKTYNFALPAVSIQMRCADLIRNTPMLFYFLSEDQLRETAKNRLVPRAANNLNQWRLMTERILADSSTEKKLKEEIDFRKKLENSAIAGMDSIALRRKETYFNLPYVMKQRIQLVDAVLDMHQKH